jgi:hypothetical protein
MNGNIFVHTVYKNIPKYESLGNIILVRKFAACVQDFAETCYKIVL